MKSLLIVRHAKSSKDNKELNDFDRPLNDRGNHDAPIMARRLLDENIEIDAFISSPAKRAKKTAQYFADEYKYDAELIVYKEELYEAGMAAFRNVVRSIDDLYDTVALFAHNPGVTDFANCLTDEQIDNLPTCGIFAVKIDTENWESFDQAPKTFWFFNYPKLKA